MIDAIRSVRALFVPSATIGGNLLLALLVGAMPRLAAQCLQHDFVPVHDSVGMWFGLGAAIDGPVAAFGAPDDYTLGYQIGSVEVFRRTANAWEYEAELVPSTPAYGAHFGRAIAIDGDRIAVGAPGCCIDTPGMVYVYRHVDMRWVEEAMLMADMPQDGAQFGYAVALDGDNLLVGAPRENVVGIQDGEVYSFIFDGTAWSLEDSFRSEQYYPYHQFGTSVALHGSTAVVGAPFDGNETGSSVLNGAAYVFQHDGAQWSQVQKLATHPDDFLAAVGQAIAFDGQTIVVGAPFMNLGSSALGAAYVYERNETLGKWQQTAALQGMGQSDHAEAAAFVAVDDDTILVGCDWNFNQPVPNVVYVFNRDGGAWHEAEPLSLPTGTAGDGFGVVGLSGDWAVVGAPYTDGEYESDGCASAFTGLSLKPAWTDLGGDLAGGGGAPLLAGRGFLSPGNTVQLDVSGALADAPAVLVIGIDQASSPLKGGTLVPTPDAVLGGYLTNELGGLHVVGHVPAAGCGLVLAFQAWIADPTGPSGWSATNAIESVTR